MRGSGGRKSKDPKVERTVPDEVYFLASDDRDLHDDSRDYGFVTIATCKTIAFRLWSKNGWGDSEHRLTYIR
jgi:signal peptidase I